MITVLRNKLGEFLFFSGQYILPKHRRQFPYSMAFFRKTGTKYWTNEEFGLTWRLAFSAGPVEAVDPSTMGDVFATGDDPDERVLRVHVRELSIDGDPADPAPTDVGHYWVYIYADVDGFSANSTIIAGVRDDEAADMAFWGFGYNGRASYEDYKPASTFGTGYTDESISKIVEQGLDTLRG